jgi:type IV secretory pathway TraG/TraD family ATPase VirD4
VDKIGFLQSAVTHKSKIPFPKYHSLTVGETGSGKTVSILYNILKKELLHAGCLLIDEKNTMHLMLKHFMSDKGFSNVFQLGDTVANGTNDIKINLLQMACGSRKSAQMFFDALVGINNSNEQKHDFWEKSASYMLRDTYACIHSMKEYLSYLEKHFSYKPQIYSKEIYVMIKESKIAVKFSITSEPLTLKRLSDYFHNKKQFMALCADSEDIIKRLGIYFKDAKAMSNKINEIKKLKRLYAEMIVASKKMKKHTVTYDTESDASGTNGVYFVAKSSLGYELADIECINCPNPKKNMITLLEQGKHIVVNSESFPVLVTNIITSRVLELLSLRAKRNRPQLVMFMADEASRVLTSSSELERVLSFGREASLKIHLAVQAETQLEQLFGRNTFISMKQNFVDIFTLSTNEYPLQQFEYYSKKEETTFTSVPIFVSRERLLLHELTFQKETHQFVDVKKLENEVVLYDSRLYEEKSRIILVNCENMDEREVEYVHIGEGNHNEIKEHGHKQIITAK